MAGAEAVERLTALARAHPRHMVLAALVAGLLSAQAPPWLVGVLAAGAVVVTGASRPAILAGFAVMAGGAWGHERLEASQTSVLGSSHGEQITGRAAVLEAPRVRPTGAPAFRVRWLDGRAHGEVAVLRLPAVPRDQPEAGRLMPGRVLRVSGRVRPLGEWEAHQRRRGARAAIEVRALALTNERRAGAVGLLDRARDSSRAGLSSGAPPVEAALLRGMVIGEDDAVPDDVRQEFRDSGLAHLLAVSGQNVMLLVALVIGVATLLGVSLRPRLLVALVLVLAYVPLAGGGPSIQRAGVMGAAGLVAALAGRATARWYALLLAAAATLAVSPLAAGDPGWQLSFAAVVALLAGAGPLSRLLTAWRLPRPLAEVIAITVLATIATAPLLVHHFGELSLVSLPANVMAAPAVAPVMWLGMLAAAVAQLDPALAGPFTAINVRLVAYIGWVAHTAAAMPHATVATELSGRGLMVALAAVFGSLAVLSHPRFELSPARRSRVLVDRGESTRPHLRLAAAMAAVVALAAIGWSVTSRARPPELAADEVMVSFLDVGQGDATLVETRGTAVLVDTGPPDGPVLERLAEAGVARLDALVVTHAQADHEGAAAAVIARLRPRLVINGGAGWPTATQKSLNSASRAAGARVVPAHAGQLVSLGGIEMEALWPPPVETPDITRDPNELALVLHLRHGDFDLLLPADAESGVLARLDLPRVDALKVSHHGSEDPGLPAVLERIRPAVAAIEVGRDNSYGHPAASTLDALRVVPEVVRTDRDGTVRLRVRPGSMRVER